MTMQELERMVQHIDDIQEITKLENIYSCYLDSNQWSEVFKMCSKNIVSVEINNRGLFKGYDGARRFFTEYMQGKADKHQPGVMHLHHQLQPVIDISEDGLSAKGRFYYLAIGAIPYEGKLRSSIGHGVYENEFVKEDGKWMFSKIKLSIHFNSVIGGGWVENPVVGMGQAPGADAPVDFFHPYPDFKLLPMHWQE